MELFNKAGGLVSSVLVAVGMLIACQAKEDVAPPAPVIQAVIESIGTPAGSAAERRLREWADQGSVLAMRELGLLYRNDAAHRADAMHLFERAALAGDSESAYQLAELYRHSAVGTDRTGQAWPWYVKAAEHRHAKAAMTLLALARTGDGVPLNEADAEKWLAVAGNVK
jgi:TPR repeat protein